MNETYTIGLSLLDFVPNLAFLFGALYLIRWTRALGSRFSHLTMTIGAILVLAGGTTKAIWKLIYTLGLGMSSCWVRHNSFSWHLVFCSCS